MTDQDIMAHTSYTLAELEAMPTLSDGYTCNLKVETERYRVWLARTTVDDGEPFNNAVTIEELVDGRWVVQDRYEAR